MDANKKTTARKPASHPVYKDMIVEALSTLKDRSGSSRQKINSFIMQKYNIEESAIKRNLKPALKRALTNGTIIQSKGVGASGSFKLPASAKNPATAAKKPAVKSAAKKPVAKKAVAKKTASSASAKRTPIKKKKPASAKKAASKSPKKPKSKVAKNPVVKKSPAKKSVVKKSPAKKAVKAKAKSPAAKKSAAKSKAKK